MGRTAGESTDLSTPWEVSEDVGAVASRTNWLKIGGAEGSYQTERQTDRQTGRQRERQTHRQTES